MKKRSFVKIFAALAMAFAIVLTSACSLKVPSRVDYGGTDKTQSASVSLAELPPFDGLLPYTVINGNVPSFSDDEIAGAVTSYEKYSPLDYLGRCGTAIASVGRDIMPTEERESIGQVKPAGWQLVPYDFIDGRYLYNRCHLIAFCLTGENANEENLITGTRYMNATGMLPFENKVANYVDDTGNHVIYRVTPIYSGTNLIADGVHMEAYSVEDNGKGISFNIFCYNVQPGVTINYKNGDNELADPTPVPDGKVTFVVNLKTGKFHTPDCENLDDIQDSYRLDYTGSREKLVNAGYVPCKGCEP